MADGSSLGSRWSQPEHHVMLGDRCALDPERVGFGPPGCEAERLVERPRGLTLCGNAERHPFDVWPGACMVDTRGNDRTPESPSSMGRRDIHAPDARAMSLLLARFAGDARHRDEPFRISRIGDRKGSAVGIREAFLDCVDLAETAVSRG